MLSGCTLSEIFEIGKPRFPKAVLLILNLCSLSSGKMFLEFSFRKSRGLLVLSPPVCPQP